MVRGYKTDLIEGVDFTVKRPHWLPRKVGVEWVAFGRTLYGRTAEGPLPKHELLHLAQFRRYGISGVLLHYAFHFVRNRWSCGSAGRAFSEIPFEREAREYESTDD
jgi:hypothetical protein